jgi:hypothetical protein
MRSPCRHRHPSTSCSKAGCICDGSPFRSGHSGSSAVWRPACPYGSIWTESSITYGGTGPTIAGSNGARDGLDRPGRHSPYGRNRRRRWWLSMRDMVRRRRGRYSVVMRPRHARRPMSLGRLSLGRPRPVNGSELQFHPLGEPDRVVAQHTDAVPRGPR